jgi:integrase
MRVADIFVSYTSSDHEWAKWIADFGGHSLRAGFLTSAAARGASIFKMADQSGHKSMDTLRGYVRNAEIFQDHAGAGLL